jgi:hypothetical protein
MAVILELIAWMHGMLIVTLAVMPGRILCWHTRPASVGVGFGMGQHASRINSHLDPTKDALNLHCPLCENMAAFLNIRQIRMRGKRLVLIDHRAKVDGFGAMNFQILGRAVFIKAIMGIFPVSRPGYTP